MAEFFSDNIVSIITLGLVLIFLVSSKHVKKFRVGANGVEVEHKTDADKIEVVDPSDLINPNDNCPYDKAYTAGRNETRKVDARVDGLEREIKQGFQTLVEKHEQREANEKKILIDLKKQTMNIPTSSTAERVLAGLECVFLGENGSIKKDAIGIALKYPEIYRAICIVRPELRIKEVEEAIAT